MLLKGYRLRNVLKKPFLFVALSWILLFESKSLFLQGLSHLHIQLLLPEGGMLELNNSFLREFQMDHFPRGSLVEEDGLSANPPLVVSGVD